MLTVLAVLVVSLLWGLIVFVWSLTAGTGAAPTGPGGDGQGASPTVTRAPGPPRDVVEAARDELAARPMPAVPLAAALPQPLATTPPAGVLGVPEPSDPQAGLPTGFPRSPQGAVAALAAIDTAAFAGLNLTTVADVHARAALPGAVPLARWTPHVGVAAVLERVDARAGDAQLHATWTLTHAQVKGVLEGGAFVVACVLGELSASYHSIARAGVADCQRMVWHDGAWRIGPGAQPAYPPSTWPGSADCVRTGWLEARRA
jgi:hypothetical protein